MNTVVRFAFPDTYKSIDEGDRHTYERDCIEILDTIDSEGVIESANSAQLAWYGDHCFAIVAFNDVEGGFVILETPGEDGQNWCSDWLRRMGLDVTCCIETGPLCKHGIGRY